MKSKPQMVQNALDNMCDLVLQYSQEGAMISTKKDMPDRVVSVRLPQELHEKLDRSAKSNLRSVSKELQYLIKMSADVDAQKQEEAKA